jgi:hypothetical protein
MVICLFLLFISTNMFLRLFPSLGQGPHGTTKTYILDEALNIDLKLFKFMMISC